MEIRAYSRDYLRDAQRSLGETFDFGIAECGYSAKDFSAFFVKSDVSRQLGIGNPKYVSGMNGCELARLILEQSGLCTDTPDIINLDKTPEYWAGWALAFYQWFSDRSYEEILTTVSLDEILGMYRVYHEMDITRFSEAMERLSRERRPQTRLRQIREKRGISPEELGRQTGLDEKQIRRLDSGQEDINRTEAWTLFLLSKALVCRMEDLIEKR